MGHLGRGGRRMRAAVLGIFAGLLALAGVALAAPALPPAPTRWVTDSVGFLSPGARAALDAKLEAYERATGHQILVWIGDSIGDEALDDWAVRTFAAWRVGRKGVDDGAVLFVLAKDRKLDLEVGYGLEERLPDAVANRVIQEVLTPRLQAGDRDGAIAAAIDAITTAIDGKPFEGSAEAVRAPARRQGSRVPFYVIAAIFVVLLIVNPRLALFFLYSIALGGRRNGDGGGGDGGGFSGGGGRSGGGGARGGW